MGARKHISAEKRKEALKSLYFAKLNGVPSSPRKMRYVVDMIRGMEVNHALGVLRFSKKQAAADVRMAGHQRPAAQPVGGQVGDAVREYQLCFRQVQQRDPCAAAEREPARV